MKSISRFALLTCLCAVNGIGCDIGLSPEEEMELSTISSAISRDFANGFVEAHNKYRAMHGAQLIHWDTGLESTAQQYANRCITTQHSPESSYLGENLASFWGGGMSTPEQVVELWYKEINDYDFNNPGYPRQTGQKIGHFTQVVWNASTAVGCGYARCDTIDFFVCQYSPKGNFGGQYAQNVYRRDGSSGAGVVGPGDSGIGGTGGIGGTTPVTWYTCAIRDARGPVGGAIVLNGCNRVGDSTGYQRLDCNYEYNYFFQVRGKLHLEGHTSSMKAQIIDQASNQVAEEGRATFNDRENTFTIEYTTPGPKHQSYFTFPTYWSCRRN